MHGGRANTTTVLLYLAPRCRQSRRPSRVGVQTSGCKVAPTAIRRPFLLRSNSCDRKQLSGRIVAPTPRRRLPHLADVPCSIKALSQPRSPRASTAAVVVAQPAEVANWLGRLPADMPLDAAGGSTGYWAISRRSRGSQRVGASLPNWPPIYPAGRTVPGAASGRKRAPTGPRPAPPPVGKWRALCPTLGIVARRHSLAPVLPSCGCARRPGRSPQYLSDVPPSEKASRPSQAVSAAHRVTALVMLM
jgi:hypothetical protein